MKATMLELKRSRGDKSVTEITHYCIGGIHVKTRLHHSDSEISKTWEVVDSCDSEHSGKKTRISCSPELEELLKRQRNKQEKPLKPRSKK